MFFQDDGEFFEYDPFGFQGAAGTEKALPFLESLLSFLELDPTDWEPLVQQAASDLEQFSSTGDAAYSDHMMQTLGELGARHIYFQLLYLRYFERKSSGILELRMTEELRQLPAQLKAYQKQAQLFLECILDIDQVGRAVQQNTKVNADVHQRQRPHVRRSGNQVQHPAGGQNAAKTQQSAAHNPYQQGGVEGLGYLLLPARFAQIPGDNHVDPHGDTHQQIDDQIDDAGRAAHGGKALMACPAAHYHDIRRVEQQLQEVGGHEGQAEQQDLSQQRTMGHVHGPGGLHALFT